MRYLKMRQGQATPPQVQSEPQPRSLSSEPTTLAQLIERSDLQATVFVPNNIRTLPNLLAIMREVEKRYGKVAEYRCPPVVSVHLNYFSTRYPRNFLHCFML